jgi:hypothetical protein
MPFKITCTNGYGMMIREENANRRVRCPTCGLTLVAIPPAIAATPPSHATHHVPTYPCRPQPKLETPAGGPAPPGPAFLDAMHAEEEEREVADYEPPKQKNRGKRVRRRVQLTRGLAMISTGLIIQVPRIIALAAGFSLAFLLILATGVPIVLGTGLLKMN